MNNVRWESEKEARGNEYIASDMACENCAVHASFYIDCVKWYFHVKQQRQHHQTDKKYAEKHQHLFNKTHIFRFIARRHERANKQITDPWCIVSMMNNSLQCKHCSSVQIDHKLDCFTHWQLIFGFQFSPFILIDNLNWFFSSLSFSSLERFYHWISQSKYSVCMTCDG